MEISPAASHLNKNRSHATATSPLPRLFVIAACSQSLWTSVHCERNPTIEVSLLTHINKNRIHATAISCILVLTNKVYFFK